MGYGGRRCRIGSSYRSSCAGMAEKKGIEKAIRIFKMGLYFYLGYLIMKFDNFFEGWRTNTFKIYYHMMNSGIIKIKIGT